jgi:hypothetical protein
MSGRIRDPFVPGSNVFWSEDLPILLENAYGGFRLIDLFAPAECQQCFHGPTPLNKPRLERR